jgi:hypothetical protein
MMTGSTASLPLVNETPSQQAIIIFRLFANDNTWAIKDSKPLSIDPDARLKRVVKRTPIVCIVIGTLG